MPKRVAFKDLTIADVLALRPESERAKETRPYVEGNHLDDGRGWCGPGPLEGTSRYSDFLDRLRRVFVFQDAVGESLDRLVGAVAGREPAWGWIPRRLVSKDKPITPVEETSKAELDAEFTTWWDDRQIHRILKKLIRFLLWAERSVWRAYVPSGLTIGGRVRATSLKQALERVYVDIPDPEDAFVYEDPDTKQRLGVVLFTDDASQQFAELTYLDETDKTVIRIVPETAATVAVGRNDFGRHITDFQLSIDAGLITPAVLSLQKALNKSLTMLSKNETDNQFLERLFFDTLPPGRYEPDKDDPSKKVYVVDEAAGRQMGNGVDNFMQSVVHEDDNTGQKTPTKGNVTFREPLDPTGAIKGSDHWYQKFLEAVRQDHILINQEATPSGKSREEARTDFAASGSDTELQLTLAGRALLETVLAMAEAFMESPGKWSKDFRPVFHPRARYGSLSMDERKQNVAEAEAGFLSDETAMSLNGIDDVDAELGRIRAQDRSTLKLSGDRAAVVTEWSVDFPREVALHLAGIPDDEIKEIMDRTTKANSTDPNAPPVVPDQGGPGAPPTNTPPAAGA